MHQLLLLCIQIICFCLTWALITFELHPFLDIYQLIFSDTGDKIPEWTVHANYLFAIIFLVTGISALLRLKVLKKMIGVSMTFFSVLLLCMVIHHQGVAMPILKYSYILLIPYVFYKVFNQNIQHIDKIIKATLQISLIYIPFSVGLFVFNSTEIHHFMAILITSTLTLVSVGASLGLYLKDYFRISLRCAEFVFFIGFVADIFQLIDSGFEYNRLPLALIGISLILFGRWVRIVSK